MIGPQSMVKMSKLWLPLATVKARQQYQKATYLLLEVWFWACWSQMKDS